MLAVIVVLATRSTCHSDPSHSFTCNVRPNTLLSRGYPTPGSTGEGGGAWRRDEGASGVGPKTLKNLDFLKFQEGSYESSYKGEGPRPGR